MRRSSASCCFTRAISPEKDAFMLFTASRAAAPPLASCPSSSCRRSVPAFCMAISLIQRCSTPATAASRTSPSARNASCRPVKLHLTRETSCCSASARSWICFLRWWWPASAASTFENLSFKTATSCSNLCVAERAASSARQVRAVHDSVISWSFALTSPLALFSRSRRSLKFSSFDSISRLNCFKSQSVTGLCSRMIASSRAMTSMSRA
mmetsp:Transcript_100329/g.189286  ORF Transcript_100329/g.189286 Transcript_100329/m.189286 type:complete len:210 (+) Transcript_100329:402-1031(+)